MCEECGCIRLVKIKAIGRGSRPLRCENCRVTTEHQAITWQSDYREHHNDRANIELPALLAEKIRMLDLFARADVYVNRGEDPEDTPGPPTGGLAQVTFAQSREDRAYVVWLRDDLSLRDLVHYLRWAWRMISRAWDGPDWGVEDGHAYKGVWNPDLEEGRYVVGEGLRRGRAG